MGRSTLAPSCDLEIGTAGAAREVQNLFPNCQRRGNFAPISYLVSGSWYVKIDCLKAIDRYVKTLSLWAGPYVLCVFCIRVLFLIRVYWNHLANCTDYYRQRKRC